MSAANQERPGIGRGPYAKSAGVRQRIIGAALQVFAESGYQASTMKAVADRAGISQRGLVHHFPSKETLLAGVLADRDAQVAQTMPRTDEPPALAALIELISQDLSKPAIVELYAVLSAEAKSPRHPAHEHYRHRSFAFRAYLEQIFDSLRSREQLKTTIPSDRLALMLMSLIDGLQGQWLYDAAAVDPKATIEQFLDEFILEKASGSRKGY